MKRKRAGQSPGAGSKGTTDVDQVVADKDLLFNLQF
jgi:hypothetical protein